MRKIVLKMEKDSRRNSACSELSLADVDCVFVPVNLQAIFLADIINLFLHFRRKQVKVEI